MNELVIKDYDLNMTLLGGQAFNWDFEPNENCFWGFTQDKVIQLKIPVGAYGHMPLQWQTYPNNDDFDFLKSYLRLDTNYKNILNKIQKDKHIKAAIKSYPYIRLLKQDFDQTLLSFLISSNNNIKSIRRIIRSLCLKFGKQINVNGDKFYLFPKTEILADAKLESLLECKLGFRAKFLKGAANYILDTELNKKIYDMNENNARTSLIEISGVGDKIADCILVFSLGFDNVTPLDIWGKRFLTRFYKLNPKMKYKDMRTWIDNYFEGYAGWAGQFLYEYIRNL